MCDCLWVILGHVGTTYHLKTLSFASLDAGVERWHSHFVRLPFGLKNMMFFSPKRDLGTSDSAFGFGGWNVVLGFDPRFEMVGFKLTP